MKSTEVYAQLKSELGPWFKSAGFKRAKGLLSWSRPQGEMHIVIWCQISQDGFDKYAGSGFVVECQRSSEPLIGMNQSRRERLGKFLSAQERIDAWHIQNNIISSLNPPPQNFHALRISPKISAWYLAKFDPVILPYAENEDIWFRHHTPEDVFTWAKFILRKLPTMIEDIESWG